MGSVRVDALGLRLVAPAAMRGTADALQRRAEDDFVPAVLAAMERRLERTYGADSVILIRRLSFRCALKPSAREAAALAELLGEDLAAQVEATAVRERGTGALPQASAAVQVYRDAAHREAAALIAAAERRAGPDGDKHDFGRAWRALARRVPAAVGAVLARCLLARKLNPVLQRLARAELEAIAAMPASALPAAVARAVGKALERPAAPTVRPKARRSAGPGARARGKAPARDTPRGPPAEGPAAPHAEPLRARTPGTSTPSPEPDVATEAETPEAAATPDPGRAPSADAAHTDAPARPTQPVRPAPAAEGAEAAPEPDVAADEPLASPALAVFESDWCGLLYLLNISLRLELPERLWQVGADEGAMLAAVFARLAREDGDLASGVLSPRFPEPAGPAPGLANWAREELVEGVRASATKLTAATASAEALHARIAAFEGWYGGSDVAGWLAACHLAVFEAMTGEPVAPGALAERLGVRGRIEVAPGEIRVVMPVEAIDLEVRRAGLDADPGWLAWLGRRMVFVFDDGAS